MGGEGKENCRPFLLLFYITGHDIPETVLLQVYCEGRVLAQSEFTYYANSQFNSDQLFHYLVQNMPQYFNMDDISGECHELGCSSYMYIYTSLCKLDPLNTNTRFIGWRAKVAVDGVVFILNPSRFSRSVFTSYVVFHVCAVVCAGVFIATMVCSGLSVPRYYVNV